MVDVMTPEDVIARLMEPLWKDLETLTEVERNIAWLSIALGGGVTAIGAGTITVKAISEVILEVAGKEALNYALIEGGGTITLSLFTGGAAIGFVSGAYITYSLFKIIKAMRDGGKREKEEAEKEQRKLKAQSEKKKEGIKETITIITNELRRKGYRKVAQQLIELFNHYENDLISHNYFKYRLNEFQILYLKDCQIAHSICEIENPQLKNALGELEDVDVVLNFFLRILPSVRTLKLRNWKWNHAALAG